MGRKKLPAYVYYIHAVGRHSHVVHETRIRVCKAWAETEKGLMEKMDRYRDCIIRIVPHEVPES